jgi:hypothetical protein
MLLLLWMVVSCTLMMMMMSAPPHVSALSDAAYCCCHRRVLLHAQHWHRCSAAAVPAITTAAAAAVAPAPVPRGQLLIWDCVVKEHHQLIASLLECTHHAAHTALLLVEVIQQTTALWAQERAQSTWRIKHHDTWLASVVHWELDALVEVLSLAVGPAGAEGIAAAVRALTT